MGVVKTAAIFILSVSFFTFVVFFGRLPALRNTPVGALNRLLSVRFPRALRWLDQRLTQGRLSSSVARWGRFMWNDRHPTVMVERPTFVVTIFFILLMFVPECLFLPPAWPHMTFTTKALMFLIVPLPYLFLYLAASTPSHITSSNHAFHMTLYPYDNTLFYPGATCKTCHFLKPPRSKHCSICKSCIARADHHCIFINACVGYNNQHYFILLLGTTALLLFYGTYLGFSILTSLLALELPEWTFFGSGLSWSDWFRLWGYAIQRNVGIGCSSLLALFTFPLVFGLFAYHIYLVWAGTTTNESLKWSDWKHEMRHRGVWKRKVEAAGSPGQEWTSWPADSVQVLVRTNDGRPPPVNARDLMGTGEWTRVRGLADVENLYDLGFWDNLRDVFVKRKERGIWNGQSSGLA